MLKIVLRAIFFIQNVEIILPKLKKKNQSTKSTELTNEFVTNGNSVFYFIIGHNDAVDNG